MKVPVSFQTAYTRAAVLQFHLVTTCPVQYRSGIAIQISLYDTHLRATHMTTSSSRGVQIPIYLVISTTDSLQQAQ